MADVKQLIASARKAINSGEKSKARELLMRAIELDKKNEQAWMWMATVARDNQEKLLALEQTLKINPTNTQARKALNQLRQKMGDSAPAPAPKRPPKEAPPKNLSDSDMFAGLDFNADSGLFQVGPEALNADPGPSAAAPSAPADSSSYNPFDDLGENPFGGADAFGGWGSETADPTPPSPPAADPFVDFGHSSTAELPALDGMFGEPEVEAPAASPTPAASPFADEEPWGSNPWESSRQVQDSGWPSDSTDSPSSPSPDVPPAEELFTIGGTDDPWGGASADVFDSPRRGTSPMPDPWGDAYAAPPTMDTSKPDPFTGKPAFAEGTMEEFMQQTSSPASSDVTHTMPAAERQQPVLPIDMEDPLEEDGVFQFDVEGGFPSSRGADFGAAGADDPFGEDAPAAKSSRFGLGASSRGAAKSARPAKAPKTAPQLAPEYAQIPPELLSKGGASKTWIVLAGILLLLNLLALLGLLLA